MMMSYRSIALGTVYTLNELLLSHACRSQEERQRERDMHDFEEGLKEMEERELKVALNHQRRYPITPKPLFRARSPRRKRPLFKRLR